MGQTVLAKQSASRLVSVHVWTSLMIFIANSRTNLAYVQTVDTRPFSFPPRKGTGYIYEYGYIYDPTYTILHMHITIATLRDYNRNKNV